jgi:hypothetical protein
LLADQQVRVGGGGPAVVPFPEPGDGEGAGELVQVDGVAGEAPADEQGPARQGEVGHEEPGCLALAEAVDGDQGDGELGHRGPGPVDQPAEPVGRDRDGQVFIRARIYARRGMLTRAVSTRPTIIVHYFPSF